MEDIIKLVENYRAPREAVEVVKNMKIALIIGITGAGKNAVQDKLVEFSDDYAEIVTTIPRLPRPHERNGVNYYFINDDQVRENLLNHKYFEAKIVHERVYGTTTAELERIAAQHKIALADVDVQGVDEYHAANSDNLTAIFLIPPDYQTWRERLFGRVKFDDDEIARRMRSAIMEIQHALNRNYYHFVINDDLDETAKLADKIIHGEFLDYNDTAARGVARELLDEIISLSNASATL
ncbi:hypothetical protein FWF74_02540 [Candidatus Saccharibacteria bacterium]|nr:hypothetical protein [Candidatus Saccharibacteria bacterium]MCL1962701.1 hypothetical protein [Candidatus Saccharibacteria bacterium]